MTKGDKFHAGMSTRRAVLGADHVDAAWHAAGADPQDIEFQDYLTEAEWGALWARPGLPRASRSIVAIVCLIALNRPVQLRIHLRSALLRNGCTRQALKEVILQTGAYCGTPAAMDALAIINEVIEEIRPVAGVAGAMSAGHEMPEEPESVTKRRPGDRRARAKAPREAPRPADTVPDSHKR